MSHGRLIAILVAATLVAAAVFRLAPGLDPALAALFYDGHGFVGQRGVGGIARAVLYWLPFGVFVALVVAFAGRAAKVWRGPAPGAGALAYLAVTLALGPGLLVNVALKEHTHRPRPVQVQAVGGTMAYRPFNRTDGGCARNCSFVSGEGSAAFWLVAPASLAPAPWRGAAVGAALAVGVLTSVLRMAFGGHFASDVVFAALFTLLIVVGAHAWMRRAPVDTREPPAL